MSSNTRAVAIVTALAGAALLPVPATPAAAVNDAPNVTWDGSHQFGHHVQGVFADGTDGWIASGSDENGAAAWTSVDGRTWPAASVGQHDDEPFGGFAMRHTARHGEALINLGVMNGFGDARSIRGWQSTDGADWEPIEPSDDIYTDGYQPRDLASAGGTMVAAEFRFVPHSGRLWTSTNADGWSQTTPVDADGYGHEYRDVIRAGDAFVVVGDRRAPGGTSTNATIQAASWTSTDGATWTASPPDPALVGHVFMAVAPLPDEGGYLALGHDDAPNGGANGTPQAWTSSDGLTWTEVAGPPAGVGAEGRLLVAIEGGFLAATVTANESGTETWTSADGDGWIPAGSFSGSPTGLDSMGAEVVLITTSGVIPQASTAHHGQVGPPRPFLDIADSPFRRDIEWLAAQGIASGCTEVRFCPTATVTRGQMATFLDRSFDFAPTTQDRFTDDNTSTHEDAINRLAAAGVTGGCSATRFCPTASVTRGQLASFLDRAMDLPAASRDWFTDDESSVHEDSINRAREAGLTFGCSATRYCPQRAVTREQMAAYLHRALTP